MKRRGKGEVEVKKKRGKKLVYYINI